MFQRGYVFYNIYLEHVQQELGGLDWPPANEQGEEEKRSRRHFHFNTSLIAISSIVVILGIVIHEWCMV